MKQTDSIKTTVKELNSILDTISSGLIIETQVHYLQNSFRPDNDLHDRNVILTTRDFIYIRESNHAIFLKEQYDNDSFILLHIPIETPTFGVIVYDNSEDNFLHYNVVDDQTGEIYFSIYSQNKFNQIIKTKRGKK